MPELAAVHAVAHGYVQGVNFRFFVERHAELLGLRGYVRNLPSGSEVEVWAEGDKDALLEFVEQLKAGPRRARVDKLDIEWREHTGRFNDFGVRF